jgi:cytochrome c5
MLVLGLLVAIAIGLIVLSRIIAGGTTAERKQDDPVYLREVTGRIAPVARVAVAGADNAALNPPVAAAAADAADLAGEDVYSQACVACHGAGVAGAPKFADAAAWAPRIAQGIETLNTHALQGFQGKGGFMPPKGGRTDLSDQSVINAVEYMVAAAK